MRLLTDENVPPGAVRRLRELGHDVLSAKESLRGRPDEAVLARAVADRRILVTFDKDFGELAFRARLPADCGVVLFRFTQHGRREDAAKVIDTLHARDDWAGAFWTVTDFRLRRRPLPESSGGG